TVPACLTTEKAIGRNAQHVGGTAADVRVGTQDSRMVTDEIDVRRPRVPRDPAANVGAARDLCGKRDREVVTGAPEDYGAVSAGDHGCRLWPSAIKEVVCRAIIDGPAMNAWVGQRAPL